MDIYFLLYFLEAYGLSKLFSIDPVFCLSIIVTGLASKATAIGKMINNIEIKV